MLRNPGSLKFFLAVVEEGSVRKAARVCNIGQPALTRKIQQLEDDLDVALFERTARGMVLTPFGRTVEHHAKQLNFVSSNLEREIAEMADGEKGLLRISAGPGWSYSIVPEAISRLQKARPGVTVECNSELVSQSVTELRAGNADVAINRFEQFTDIGVDVVCEKLLTIDHYVFAGPGHPLLNTEVVEVADLALTHGLASSTRWRRVKPSPSYSKTQDCKRRHRLSSPILSSPHSRYWKLALI